ncbi:hypothetical protein [Nitrincola sp.]|uniref:hypothetical protein n=1 Tax=Nitrincola sp. TaxID=1926584 RepID=UPI003A93C326
MSATDYKVQAYKLTDDQGRKHPKLMCTEYQSIQTSVAGDVEKAWDCLAIAAKYMKRGLPVPLDLAEHLAEAIEMAMHKPVNNRLTVLSKELHLAADNRRKVPYHPLEVFEFVEAIKDEHPSLKKAFESTGKTFGIGRSTVERLYKEAVNYF